ncbi:MAG: FAD-dependent oxidoreductase [Spirochaetes bacterium]|nr:FAD-dependent oxidoreductase [Spirochaetota bacterium]
MIIHEPARETNVRDSYDVIVAGGGLGGVAAAIASARSGARTIVIERNSYLGGVATAGMCCSIFNCFYTSEGKLGTFGIPVEIADRFAAAEGFGAKWHKHKGHIIYDIEQAKLTLETMVRDAGADILYDAVIAGTVMEGNTVSGVIVETKSGREAIRAKVVVDASGDADVAHHANAKLKVTEKGIHSLCFRLGNVDVDQFVDFFRKHPDQYPERMDVDWNMAEALAHYDDCGTFLFPHGGGMQMEAFAQAKRAGDLPATVGIQDTTDACQMHLIRRNNIAHVVTGFTHFNGIDADMITKSYIDGRKMAFTVADVYRKYIPGFDTSFIAGVADNLGVRVSRSLDSDFTFTGDMVNAGTRHADAVAVMVGYKDIKKHTGKNAWGVQVMERDTFDLPYRALLPQNVDGLIMGAGRSISARNPMVLRAMVPTMVVGQAAGIAAAVSVKNGTSPRSTDAAKIRAEGMRLGAYPQ